MFLRRNSLDCNFVETQFPPHHICTRKLQILPSLILQKWNRRVGWSIFINDNKLFICSLSLKEFGTLAKKFNINEKTGCHEVYSHKTDSSGYPIVKKNNKSIRIHRYNYQLKNGVIPRELVVRHICDNKMCVNVDHLLIGTHADNVKDIHIDKNKNKKNELYSVTIRSFLY